MKILRRLLDWWTSVRVDFKMTAFPRREEETMRIGRVYEWL